jgi:very-short-patch-repair endonuclease
MVRKIDSYRAKPPEKFRLPSVPKKSRFTDKFTSLEPHPRLTDSQQQDFMERFNAWRSSSHKYVAGSVPEFIVFDYLTRTKKWKDGEEFRYQYNLYGGRTAYGGFVLDYFIVLGQLAWNIQGLRYHLLNVKDRAKVQVQDQMLSARGFRVLSLWEDDLLERPEFTIEAGLRGQSTNRHQDNQGFLH